MRAPTVLLTAGLVVAAAGVARATGVLPAPPVPRARFASSSASPQEYPEVPYDGRFTFVRIRYTVGGGSGMRGFGRRREDPWHHDYPRAETNFAKIIAETTLIDPFMDGSRILRMDDPEVFKYPIIYVVEVGYWNPGQAEIDALGEYLQKGGFLIVDDFRGRDIYQIQAILQQALPGVKLLEVPDDHEIFNSFFRIDDPHSLLPPYDRRDVPVYVGVFEDNDPTKRLMAILNYNNDIAEYWEFSDVGYYPIDLSNEAYKFGVNYLVYAMTH